MNKTDTAALAAVLSGKANPEEMAEGTPDAVDSAAEEASEAKPANPVKKPAKRKVIDTGRSRTKKVRVVDTGKKKAKKAK